MNVIYYLSNCSTCKRIIHELKIGDKFIFREIKSEPLTLNELEILKELAGSYEKIFSKIAMKYRIWGLNEKNLTEEDFKRYILEEYTFIKRPLIIVENKIFIGSSRPSITAAREAINKLNE